MRFIHRIGKNFDRRMQAELAAIGFEVTTGFDVFEIDEADERWPLVKDLAKKWQTLDNLITKFSRTEINEAELLALSPAWHHQYPEPSRGHGDWSLSFDLTNYCHACGIGKTQSGPLRIKSEPKWGRRQILQLNWLFDEYLVTPEAWERVFRPFGIECRPVIQHKTGKELTTVVQLAISPMAHCSIATDSRAEPQICSQCGRVKYHAILRGMWPSIVDVVTVPLFKTHEYFGSGGSAWQQVIATPELYRAAEKASLKGVSFEPVASGPL